MPFVGPFAWLITLILDVGIDIIDWFVDLKAKVSDLIEWIMSQKIQVLSVFANAIRRLL